MAKISEQDYRDATEGFMYLLSVFQQGFKTIQKENAELSTFEQIALTDAWWKGVMRSAGIAGGKNNDSQGLF